MYAVIEKNTFNHFYKMFDSSFESYEEAFEFASAMNNFRPESDRRGLVFKYYYCVRKLD